MALSEAVSIYGASIDAEEALRLCILRWRNGQPAPLHLTSRLAVGGYVVDALERRYRG